MTRARLYRAYLAVMILAAVVGPGYLGAATVVVGHLPALQTAAEAAAPFAPALAAAAAGLGLSVTAGPGTLRLSRFRLAVLLDSPRSRSRWLAPRIWVPVALACAVVALIASIPLAAGAGQWWIPWLILLPLLAGLFAAAAALGQLCSGRMLLTAQIVAWGLAILLSAGALCSAATGLGWPANQPPPIVGILEVLSRAIQASTPVAAAASATVIAVVAGAVLFPRLLRRVDERALLERADRVQAASTAVLTGDSAQLGRALVGWPAHAGRLGRTPRHLPALRLRLRAHLLGAVRRPHSLVPAGVAALAAIACLVLTAHVPQGALWVPVTLFMATASAAIRPFDQALGHGLSAGFTGLSGLHPAAEAALALALPGLLLALIVAVACVAASGTGLHAVLLVPAVVALRVRALFAPPMPTDRLVSLPTAAGDMQGLRVVLWLIDAPLRIGLLGVAAGLAWQSMPVLAALGLGAAGYAAFAALRRIRCAL